MDKENLVLGAEAGEYWGQQEKRRQKQIRNREEEVVERRPPRSGAFVQDAEIIGGEVSTHATRVAREEAFAKAKARQQEIAIRQAADLGVNVQLGTQPVPTVSSPTIMSRAFPARGEFLNWGPFVLQGFLRDL